MRRSLGSIIAGVVIGVALVVFPAAAVAAPASATFQIQGVEIAFSSTRGMFVGYGEGTASEGSAWEAVVDHTPLSSQPVSITGGRFSMGTLSLAPSVDFVVGTFTGGTITEINPGTGCTKQTFRVSGTVGDVSTSTTSDGTGLFDVVLTHHRRSFFGRCVTYAATVSGSASFTY
jgi:hypothetical protein